MNKSSMKDPQGAGTLSTGGQLLFDGSDIEMAYEVYH